MTYRPRHSRPRQRRQFNRPILAGCFICLLGSLIFLYPDIAAWVASINQSHVINAAQADVTKLSPSAAEQIRRAHAYNKALSSGALLAKDARIPTGIGVASEGIDNYRDLLNAGPDGLMGHIHIPSISLDLPIYHGSDDETLLKGAGHLEGTSLPVGGTGTRTVITAHRGLAEAEMFTRLNEVATGDIFSLTIVGQTITYKVIDIQTVDPDESHRLRADPARDLATLVTCTPLGINTQRILVTGERIYPTPAAEEKHATEPVTVDWPWWAVYLSIICAILTAVAWKTRQPVEVGKLEGGQSTKKGSHSD